MRCRLGPSSTRAPRGPLFIAETEVLDSGRAALHPYELPPAALLDREPAHRGPGSG